MLDPMTMQAMAQASGQIAQGLGQALKDAPVQQGGPSTAFLDGSGWTVATGGSRTAARRNDASGMPVLSDMGTMDPALLIAGVVLLAVVFIKRARA